MSGRPPAVVADSTISLPSSVLQGLPIFTVPFEVHHDGQVYADGVDLSASEFYGLLRTSQVLPTTSAPQPGAFLNAFQQAAAHSDQILCLTVSSDLSAAYQAALLAKEEAQHSMAGVEVHVVDTRTAGPAEGLLALEAVRLSAAGASLQEVQAAIVQRLKSVCLMAYMETLYYVWRGGRVPRAALWLARLLDVKPILELSAGRIGLLERPRTRRRARDRLVTLVQQRLGGRPGRVAVMHADAPDEAQELAELLQRKIEPVELLVTEFAPVLGAHTGPGVVGCAFCPVASVL